MAEITVTELYKKNRLKLKLKWVAGLNGGHHTLNNKAVTKPTLALFGHLNYVYPNRVHVMGCAEMDFLKNLSTKEAKSAIKNLYSTDLAAVIIANDEKVPQFIKKIADQYSAPLFTSTLPSPALMDMLSHFLANAVADSTSMHGVFMEVQGFGALITGDAAIGKSELAVELITRGHRLVADDIIDFFHISPERVEGRCPLLLQDFLEVRGLGILNIRELFGDNAVKPSKPLDLIIHLAHATQETLLKLDRLSTETQYETVLGVKIPKFTIPIAAGRNIAVLVEVAIRNHILLMRGINSTKQFTKRQKKAIKKSK